MYTRNNDARRDCRDICPPENYSGSAFPERGCDCEAEVKIDNCQHENNPSQPPPPPSEKMCGNFGSDKCETDCRHEEFCQEKQPPPCPEDRRPLCDDQKRPAQPCPPPRNDGLISRLFGRFKGFRKEDLLLIGLVMFLILGDNDECEKPCDDDRQDNSDLLLILALILLLS